MSQHFMCFAAHEQARDAAAAVGCHEYQIAALGICRVDDGFVGRIVDQGMDVKRHAGGAGLFGEAIENGLGLALRQRRKTVRRHRIDRNAAFVIRHAVFGLRVEAGDAGADFAGKLNRLIDDAIRQLRTITRNEYVFEHCDPPKARMIRAISYDITTMKVIQSQYRAVQPYITKDGSAIRELMHPSVHGNRQQSLAEASVAPSAQTALHLHRATEEIYHFTQGNGVMRLGAETFAVAAGDTVAIPPGTPHCVRNTGDEPLKILCACSPAYSHDDTLLLEQ